MRILKRKAKLEYFLKSRKSIFKIVNKFFNNKTCRSFRRQVLYITRMIGLLSETLLDFSNAINQTHEKEGY